MRRLHNGLKKIKDCEQIEEDLSEKLILPGDYHFLSEKLDTIRLNLAILYAESKELELTEEKSSYKEIKDFILDFYGVKAKIKV